MTLPVTVAIPVHRTNRNEAWLREAVKSFPAGVRVLVMENDGPDEVAASMNAAIEQTETEFFFPFGADDVATNGMLETLCAYGWSADVVYPQMLLTDEELAPYAIFPADVFCEHRLTHMNFVSGCSLVRTSKLREVGGYRSEVRLEDWDLWVRLHRAGARFKPCPEATMMYRQVHNSRNKDPDPAGALVRARAEIVGDPPAEPLASFYYQATPVTAYLRCAKPAKYLPGRALNHLHYVNPPDERPVEFPDHAGAAVLQFAGDSTWAILTHHLQEQGVRVLVETDDNYLVDAPRMRKRAKWGRGIGEEMHTIEGHRSIVKWADGVIVTTEQLAKAYRKFNPNVYVCPNQLEPADWPAYEKPDDGKFRIGWFASISHDTDVPLVRRAFEWASRQKDVEVVMMGLNPGFAFPYRQLPWSNDLHMYWKAMMWLDVSCAPVIPTPWSVCRSDIKAVESAMAGALPLVSDEAPYEWWHGRPALTAKTAKDFYHHVKWCVRHRDEVRQMAAEARELVLAERTYEANVECWRAAVSG